MAGWISVVTRLRSAPTIALVSASADDSRTARSASTAALIIGANEGDSPWGLTFGATWVFKAFELK